MEISKVNIASGEINTGNRKTESELMLKLSVLRRKIAVLKNKATTYQEGEAALKTVQKELDNSRNDYIELLNELTSLKTVKNQKEMYDKKLNPSKKVDHQIKADKIRFDYMNDLNKNIEIKSVFKSYLDVVI